MFLSVHLSYTISLSFCHSCVTHNILVFLSVHFHTQYPYLVIDRPVSIVTGVCIFFLSVELASHILYAFT